MASGTFLEREVKLDSDSSFQMPDLRGVVARVVQKPAQELRTAYFDTPDLRLWGRGVSFRHRLGEERGSGTWTIKLPSQVGSKDGPGATLDRTEMSWSGDRDVMPPQAISLLRGIVRGAALSQVTELMTTRRRLVLHDVGETACVELDDDTVAVVGGPGHGMRFRQVEVELGSGGRSILAAVVRQLRKAGAELSAEPKLAKALRCPAGPGPVRARTLKHRDRLRAVVEASIADALGCLLDHDYRLRADPPDPPPHSVHQARVATRRLRSDLKTFRFVLDPVWLDQTRAELKWLGEVFGNVRDPDVLAGHLSDDGQGDDDGPVHDVGGVELRAQLAIERRTALGELSTVLSSRRYFDLLDRLQSAAHRAPFASALTRDPDGETRAAEVLPALVGRQWKVLRRRVRRAGDSPSDHQLHQIRIGAKQLRYAAELAEPVMGPKAGRTARAAENLQTILGEHHDAVTAEQWLRQVALRATPMAAFQAGRLSAEQHRRQRKLRRQWRSAWNQIDRENVRGWLR
ncbi:MAG TPA: CYTH and CHAD domain-containing protein [Acidimicrobiales bacterium]|jgi:CHAD domain-containing protein